MKPITINPNNEPFFSDDFISGFKCGVRRQYEADKADRQQGEMSDLISRQAAITIPILPVEHRKYKTMNLDDAYELGWYDCRECIEDLPSAQTMSDLISRQAAIDAVHNYWKAMVVTVPTKTTKYGIAYDTKQLDEILEHNKKLVGLIKEIPVRGAFTIDEAAEMLSSLFADECACNYNNIDEWLPQRCKYCAAGECPDPPDKHGCWKQFLVHGYKLREGGDRK